MSLYLAINLHSEQLKICSVNLKRRNSYGTMDKKWAVWDATENIWNICESILQNDNIDVRQGKLKCIKNGRGESNIHLSCNTVYGILTLKCVPCVWEGITNSFDHRNLEISICYYVTNIRYQTRYSNHLPRNVLNMYWYWNKITY